MNVDSGLVLPLLSVASVLADKGSEPGSDMLLAVSNLPGFTLFIYTNEFCQMTFDQQAVTFNCSVVRNGFLI